MCLWVACIDQWKFWGRQNFRPSTPYKHNKAKLNKSMSPLISWAMWEVEKAEGSDLPSTGSLGRAEMGQVHWAERGCTRNWRWIRYPGIQGVCKSCRESLRRLASGGRGSRLTIAWNSNTRKEENYWIICSTPFSFNNYPLQWLFSQLEKEYWVLKPRRLQEVECIGWERR